LDDKPEKEEMTEDDKPAKEEKTKDDKSEKEVANMPYSICIFVNIFTNSILRCQRKRRRPKRKKSPKNRLVLDLFPFYASSNNA
jgi:hypothetical protein